MLLNLVPVAAMTVFAGDSAHDLIITGEEETDYSWSGDRLTIKTSGLTVSGTTTKERIQTTDNVSELTFDNLSIVIPGTIPIEFNGAANLILQGDNFLTSVTTEYDYGDDGIRANRPLEISGDGNLTISGGDDGISTYDDLIISASGTIDITGLGFTGIYARNNTKITFTDSVNKVIVRGDCSYGAFFLGGCVVLASDYLNIKGASSFEAEEEKITGNVAYGPGLGNVRMVSGGSAGAVMITRSFSPSHNYGYPEFKWEGYEKCTATATCNCGDTQTKDCTVTSRVTYEPTRTSDGERVYTASAEFGGITYTCDKSEVIPRTGPGSSSDEPCPKCGGTHADNFWGQIVCFFNRIIKWFKDLF